MTWKTLTSSIDYSNPYFRVRKDTVIRPNGEEGTYYVVERQDGVFVVAVDRQMNVHMVELRRYTNGNLSLEVPAGGIGDQRPLDAAKRELKEETGLAAEKWKLLGVVHPANGTLSGKNYVYLAEVLTQTGSNEQEDEGIDKAIKIPMREALSMVRDGRITDSESITPLTLAAMALGLIPL